VANMTFKQFAISAEQSSTVSSGRISWHILRLLGLELETYFQNFLGFVFALRLYLLHNHL